MPPRSKTRAVEAYKETNKTLSERDKVQAPSGRGMTCLTREGMVAFRLPTRDATPYFYQLTPSESEKKDSTLDANKFPGLWYDQPSTKPLHTFRDELQITAHLRITRNLYIDDWVWTIEWFCPQAISGP